MVMDEMYPDVKAALKEAKFNLNGSMVAYIVLVVIGMLLVSKILSEEGNPWVAQIICIGCLSVPLMFMFIIYYYAIRSVKDAEGAYSRQQICDALRDVEKSLLLFLIASLVMSNFVGVLITAFSYARIKRIRKDLQSESVKISAPESVRTPSYRVSAEPSRRTGSEMDEDTPPPGVDYWEWKKKHGYWARKRRGEP